METRGGQHETRLWLHRVSSDVVLREEPGTHRWRGVGCWAPPASLGFTWSRGHLTLLETSPFITSSVRDAAQNGQFDLILPYSSCDYWSIIHFKWIRSFLPIKKQGPEERAEPGGGGHRRWVRAKGRARSCGAPESVLLGEGAVFHF